MYDFYYLILYFLESILFYLGNVCNLFSCKTIFSDYNHIFGILKLWK